MKAPCGDAACGEDAGLSLRAGFCLLPGPPCSSRAVFHTGSVLRNTTQEASGTGLGTQRPGTTVAISLPGDGAAQPLLFQELCSAEGGCASSSLVLHSPRAFGVESKPASCG